METHAPYKGGEMIPQEQKKALEELGIKGYQREDGLWILDSPYVVTSLNGKLFAEGGHGVKELTHIIDRNNVCEVTGSVILASPMDNLKTVGGEINACASMKDKIEADMWIQIKTKG
jgi:ribulose 1,5-bisphosphate synthetase/thiazole synthase